MTHPNLEMLRIAVENLGTLADEMIFVGGWRMHDRTAHY